MRRPGARSRIEGATKTMPTAKKRANDCHRTRGRVLLMLGGLLMACAAWMVQHLALEWWIPAFILMIWGVNASVFGVLILKRIVTLKTVSHPDVSGETDDRS